MKFDRTVETVSVVGINANPLNPREVFPEGDLRELQDSIQRFGLLEPLVVRPLEGCFEVVSGARRLRVLREVGPTAPCVVRPFSDAEAVIARLTIQSRNPVEAARGYGRLGLLGYSDREVAEAVGVPLATVCHRWRLLELADSVQDQVLAGELPDSHAWLLARIGSLELQIRIVGAAIRKGWDYETVAECTALLESHGPDAVEMVLGP
jgi:ParB family chromosome partitioning protein